MAIRSFPADVKLQNFYTQNYEKEASTRLQWYFDSKRGGDGCNNSASRSHSANRYLRQGLPSINPMEYALKQKKEEDARIRQIQMEARKKYTSEEMRKVDRKGQAQLFDGFSKEGRGRYQYLQQRHEVIPERKYTFPILSSWDYGWKFGQEAAPRKPHNARTKLITDTFYTRNGVPTLPEPTERPSMDRSVTVI